MKLLYGMFLITCLFVFVFHFELFGSFAWHEISIISGEFGYCPFHQLDFELILSNRLIEKLFRVYIASSKQERGGGELRPENSTHCNLQRCTFTSQLLRSKFTFRCSFFRFCFHSLDKGGKALNFEFVYLLLLFFSSGSGGKRQSNSKAKFGKVFSISNICYSCLKLLYERCKCFEL